MWGHGVGDDDHIELFLGMTLNSSVVVQCMRIKLWTRLRFQASGACARRKIPARKGCEDSLLS